MIPSAGVGCKAGKGRAPDRILAARSTNGIVDRTRPLCAYPQIATYAGKGSVDEAANFVCRDDGKR